MLRVSRAGGGGGDGVGLFVWFFLGGGAVWCRML